jgi:hypothetical protein
VSQKPQAVHGRLTGFGCRVDRVKARLLPVDGVFRKPASQPMRV